MQKVKMYILLTIVIYTLIIVGYASTSARVSEENVLNKQKPIKTYILKTNKTINSKTSIPYYNPNDVTKVSNIGRNTLYSILEGTRLQEWTDYFIEGEEIYGVNAFFIIGIVVQESGWGTSDRANNGSYNLVGYNVTKPTDKGYHFDSYRSCIFEVFRLIGEEYTNEQGKFYNGKSSWSINKKYSSDKKWADNIGIIICGIIKCTD